MTIETLTQSQWDHHYAQSEQAHYTQSLEAGNILILPNLAFALTQAEQPLLSSIYSKRGIKNISFNPNTNTLQGMAHPHPALKAMLERYAQSAHQLASQLLGYQQLKSGRTSFRPIEIAEHRPPSYRKDDTRLHVDAFPSTPTQGKRIIRVFTNINPHGQSRVWRVGEPFEMVAKRFLPKTTKQWFGRATLFKALKITRDYCSDYDYIMLQIHNQMKADLGYQQQVQHTELAFSPGTTWIVATDQVSHAAMRGQYVLEQTFYLAPHNMQNPAQAPLKVLERLSNRNLVSSR